jgi:hypothetical protein
MTVDMHAAFDLFMRAEDAVQAVTKISVDTGIVFHIRDVVDLVERGLPEDYPYPAEGTVTREGVIGVMVEEILNEAGYNEEP